MFLRTCTGPIIKDTTEYLTRQLGAHVATAALLRLDARAFVELRRDEESVYSLTSAPGLLLLARAVLVSGAPLMKHLQSVWWWSGRCALAHQALLENNVLELRGHVERAFATAMRDVPESEPGSQSAAGQSQSGNNADSRSLASTAGDLEEADSGDEGAPSDPLAPAAPFDVVAGARRERAARLVLVLQAHIESAHADFTFWNYRRMLSSLERAQGISGLRSTMSGAKGVRTKFQIDDKSQLFVDARSSTRVQSAEARVYPHAAANARAADSIELEKQHQARMDAHIEAIRQRRRARQLARRRAQIDAAAAVSAASMAATEPVDATTATLVAAAADESVPLAAASAAAVAAEVVDPPTDEELDAEMPGWRESPATDKVDLHTLFLTVNFSIPCFSTRDTKIC